MNISDCVALLWSTKTKKKYQQRFVVVVIICFMSLLKSNSLFFTPLERKSASKQNEKLLYCVVCTFDEASRKERHHVAIVCNALFLILVIVYTLLGQKTPKSLLPHRKLSLIFSLSPSHFLSLFRCWVLVATLQVFLLHKCAAIELGHLVMCWLGDEHGIIESKSNTRNSHHMHN